MRALKYSNGKVIGYLALTTPNAPWNVPRLVRYADRRTPINVRRR